MWTISHDEAARHMDRLMQRMRHRHEGWHIIGPDGARADLLPERWVAHVRHTQRVHLRTLRRLAASGAESRRYPMTSLPAGVEVAWAGGYCPVQIEGFVDGRPFYFRARGAQWTFDVGRGFAAIDPDGPRQEAWSVRCPFGEHPDAGYLAPDEAAACLAAAIRAYRDDRAAGRVGAQRPPESRVLPDAPTAPQEPARPRATCPERHDARRSADAAPDIERCADETPDAERRADESVDAERRADAAQDDTPHGAGRDA